MYDFAWGFSDVTAWDLNAKDAWRHFQNAISQMPIIYDFIAWGWSLILSNGFSNVVACGWCLVALHGLSDITAWKVWFQLNGTSDWVPCSQIKYFNLKSDMPCNEIRHPTHWQSVNRKPMQKNLTKSYPKNEIRNQTYLQALKSYIKCNKIIQSIKWYQISSCIKWYITCILNQMCYAQKSDIQCNDMHWRKSR